MLVIRVARTGSIIINYGHVKSIIGVGPGEAVVLTKPTSSHGILCSKNILCSSIRSYLHDWCSKETSLLHILVEFQSVSLWFGDESSVIVVLPPQVPVGYGVYVA